VDLILISDFNINLCIEKERVYVHIHGCMWGVQQVDVHLHVCTYPAPYMSVGHHTAMHFVLI